MNEGETGVKLHNHHGVSLLDENGDRVQAYACKVTPADFNEDGTVSLPLSGECNCFDTILATPDPSNTWLGEKLQGETDLESYDAEQLALAFSFGVLTGLNVDD